MANQQVTDIDLGWLAGIIDGEGWVGAILETEHWYREGMNTRQKSIKVEINVVNCDPAIVERAATIIRELGVNPYMRHSNRNQETKRPVYTVAVKRMAGVQRLLVVLRDHLTGSKQRRADLLLRFIHLRQTNPGTPNPAYANGARGRHGPGTIRPYTVEELELIEQCRALQDRSGTSEATRATGEATLRKMKARVAEQRGTGTIAVTPDEMLLLESLDEGQQKEYWLTAMTAIGKPNEPAE